MFCFIPAVNSTYNDRVFFPYVSSVLLEGFYNLSVNDGTVLELWISEQNINQFLKIGGRRLVMDLLIRIILTNRSLS